MGLDENSQDPTLNRWAKSLKKLSTKHGYVNSLLNYCQFLQLTPTKARDEAKAEQIQNVFKSDRRIREHFEDFNYYLSDQDLSPNTIHSYFNGIKSFYMFYDIDVPRLKLDSCVTKQGNLKIPTKSDIQDALSVADPLEKVLILTGVSSGLAANEISNLRVSDLSFDDAINITTIKVRRIKTAVDYYTFLTPEATAAVKEYIRYRSRTSEDERKNKALLKQKIYSNSDYLFCVRKVPNEFLETKDESLRKLGMTGLMSIYRDLSEKISKSTGKGEFNFIRSHTMRKYFDSVLLNSGCDFFHTEYFMGHKLPATQAHYFTANVDKLKELYAQFVPYLTIQKELDVSESAEFKRIKEENAILAAEAVKATVERAELQELRAAVDLLYKEVRNDPDRYLIGAKLVKKMNPNRLVLPPDNRTDQNEPDY